MQLSLPAQLLGMGAGAWQGQHGGMCSCMELVLHWDGVWPLLLSFLAPQTEPKKSLCWMNELGVWLFWLQLPITIWDSGPGRALLGLCRSPWVQSAGFAPVCVCDLGMGIPTQQKGDNRSYHQLCWAHMQELLLWLLLASSTVFTDRKRRWHPFSPGTGSHWNLLKALKALGGNIPINRGNQSLFQRLGPRMKEGMQKNQGNRLERVFLCWWIPSPSCRSHCPAAGTVPNFAVPLGICELLKSDTQ